MKIKLKHPRAFQCRRLGASDTFKFDHPARKPAAANSIASTLLNPRIMLAKKSWIALNL